VPLSTLKICTDSKLVTPLLQ